MPTVEQIIDTLSYVPFFQNLKKRQIEQLAKRVVVRTFQAGDQIVVQGEQGAGMFVVVSGKAEAVRTRVDGTKIVVNSFGPTDFFGELSLLDSEPRTASVVAVQDTECMVLSRWEFVGELRADADMAIVILQEMARRFRKTLNTF